MYNITNVDDSMAEWLDVLVDGSDVLNDSLLYGSVHVHSSNHIYLGEKK